MTQKKILMDKMKTCTPVVCKVYKNFFFEKKNCTRLVKRYKHLVKGITNWPSIAQQLQASLGLAHGKSQVGHKQREENADKA